MNKFRVGDIVVGNKLANDNYGITVKGWEGIVTFVGPNRFHATSIKYKDAPNRDELAYGGLDYDCFDLKTPKNPLISKLEGL